MDLSEKRTCLRFLVNTQNQKTEVTSLFYGFKHYGCMKDTVKEAGRTQVVE